MYEKLKDLFPENGHINMLSILNTVHNLAVGVENALAKDASKVNQAIDLIKEFLDVHKKT